MKTAFWVIFVVGFALCSTVGIGPTLNRAGGSWLSWPMILGSVLGVALLALAVVFVKTGLRPSFLSTDTAIVAALVGLLVVKVGVSAVHAALVTASTKG